jgi:hypothetical protein
MDDNRILELALETLSNRKAEIELEIEAIQIIMNAAKAQKPVPHAAVAPSKRAKSEQEKRALSKKMKEIWAKRKAAAAAKTRNSASPRKA